MLVTKENHNVSKEIFTKLLSQLPSLSGGTIFTLGTISKPIKGKDGLGGLIEEWVGAWAKLNKISIYDPKVEEGISQEFPDYYVGDCKDGYLEIKSFNSERSPAFDIANFESYCESLAANPHKLFSDYLIFSYKLDGAKLKIINIWLKKIWEITCASKEFPLRTQNKRNVIYNIRPGSFQSLGKNKRYQTFTDPKEFVDALYETEKKYNGNKKNENQFNISLVSNGIDLNKI